VLESMPSHYAVTATQTFLAHVSHRHHLFIFSPLEEGVPLEAYARNPDFLVVDEGRIQTNERRALDQFVSRGWSQVFHYDDLTLYARPDMDIAMLRKEKARWQTLVQSPGVAYRKMARYGYKRILGLLILIIGLGLCLRRKREIDEKLTKIVTN
jgi:hypothetical protein